MLDVSIKLVKEPKTFDVEIDNAINKALEECKSIVLNSAQYDHRYQIQTGRLKNATKVDVKKYNLRAYIDARVAKYGKYVHEGHGTWQADKFINNAVDNNINTITQAFIRNINQSIGI